MRKLFLDDLPRKKSNKKAIDWEKCIGRKIEFVCDDISGIITIIEFKDRKLKIRYKDYADYISTKEIKRCSFNNFIREGKFKKYSNRVLNHDFKINIGDELLDNDRNLKIVDRKIVYNKNNQRRKIYQYVCRTCGWDNGWKEECDLLHHKTGCSCCSNRTLVNGINDIPSTAPWMISYFPGGINEAKKYTKFSSKEIYPKCPYCSKIYHHKISIGTIYLNSGFSCSCKDGISYPEKFFISFLDQLNIPYIYQVTNRVFEWNIKYRYDFYLPELNCIIETNGAQHYRTTNWSSLENIQKNDSEKERLALQNGIRYYITLDCSDSSISHISNSIISSKIPSLIDIKKVQWSQCGDYASSSITKNICSYYEMCGDWEKTAYHFHLSKTTIRSYLIKGNELGWCSYPKYSYRKIMVFKDNNFLGTFTSSKYIDEHSIELFGVDLGQTQIIHNCNYNKNGLHKKYKGYSFYFENDNPYSDNHTKK